MNFDTNTIRSGVDKTWMHIVSKVEENMEAVFSL